MQEPIIDEETFNIVYQMRHGRRRNTATGRTNLFSGLTFCGECGAKMYYCSAKSIKENQNFFRCSAYKENRGTCSIHFNGNVVLENLVLETIKSVAKYISEYEPVFLYLYSKNHKLATAKEMRNAKLKLEQAKKRVGELDKLIKSVFEQHILGTLSDESYRTMIADYEEEQREVKQFILESETEVQTAKQETADLKDFLVAIRKCTDITELTPALVNTHSKRKNGVTQSDYTVPLLQLSLRRPRKSSCFFVTTDYFICISTRLGSGAEES